MEINRQACTNCSLKNAYSRKNGTFIPHSKSNGTSPLKQYLHRYSKVTVEELFSLVRADGKIDLPLDDLKKIFSEQKSRKVLEQYYVKAIELRGTEKTTFLREVSYLFDQVNNGHWIDGTKKYESFTIIKEKPNGISQQNNNNHYTLSVLQLMSDARRYNDDPKTLDIALKYYEQILAKDAHDEKVIVVMMSLAHYRYENDLESQLKIYGAILKHDPSNEQTISVMMSIAHKKYGNDLQGQLKIYETILRHVPDNEHTIAVIMDIAHKRYGNDLDCQLKIYELIFKYRPDRDHTIAVAMDVAHQRYEHDLDSQLKIYETILRYVPDHIQTIVVMMDIAHQRYQMDIDSMLKIYEVILKYHPTEEATIAIMMSVAHQYYEHDIDSQLRFYETILRYNPGRDATIAVMMDISHQYYEKDPEKRLKIFETILRYNPKYKDTIAAMRNIAKNVYRYNSTEFIAMLNLLEKYHPISEYDRSDSEGKRIILDVLYLKKEYQRILKLASGASDPELLILQADSLRKLKAYSEAIELISSIDLGAVALDLRAQLTTCRLYCIYEMNKGSADKLMELEDVIEHELSLLANPPTRLLALLGYCYDSIGKAFNDDEYKKKAEKAFAEIKLKDPSNAKASRYYDEQDI